MAEGPSIDSNLRWERIPLPPEVAAMAKAWGIPIKGYQCQVEDGHLTAIVAKEPNRKDELRWHLSISHRSSLLVDRHGSPYPDRVPTWDEMKDARYRFMPKYAWIAIPLPPPEVYFNWHPTTMHLHEIDDLELL